VNRLDGRCTLSDQMSTSTGHRLSTAVLHTLDLVVPPIPTREQRRLSTEQAILDAAAQRFAEVGPDGASMRDLARSAGVTHPLIARHFGSKQGLVDRIGERLTDRIRVEVDAVGSCDAQGIGALVRSFRADPTTTKLLIRCGLGDLRPDDFPACLAVRWSSSQHHDGRGADSRSHLGRYAAASLMLGWLTLDGFLIPAMRLGNVGVRGRDDSMAGAAARLLTLGAADEPAAAMGRTITADAGREVGAQAADTALLTSAMELFARHGPASVSIRDVARHAGVNHGLVHRHFGSKEDLIAAALDAAVSPLLPGALASGGFDLADVVLVAHRDPTSTKLIARALVDGLPIGAVRRSYPVMRSLLTAARQAAAASRPAHLEDPRLAAAATAAMVCGSALYGDTLRQVAGIRGDVVPAMTVLSRQLLGSPQ
jgi:TetR/AcrR family transcriptional regulator, repressor for neighboring sulfatase